MLWALGLGGLGCAHPAERALSGRWLGDHVENVGMDELATATAFARGTSFVFSGDRLTVEVPEEEPRHGIYRLSKIEDRTVRLEVFSSDGESSQLEIIVDDREKIRWVLGEGRTMVLNRD